MNFYANKPLGFWQLVGNCFSSYATVYKKAWQIVLLAAIISFIAGAVSGLNEKIVIIITIVLFLIAALFNATILCQSDKALANKPANISDSFKVATQRYLPFLICYFVLSFLLFLMILSIIMSLVTAGPGLGELSVYFNTQMSQLPAWWAAVFVVLAIIFLIITVFLYVAPAIVILQKGVGAFAAFKQSAELVKNHWWRIFSVLAIVHIVMILIFAIVGLIFPANQALMVALRNFVFQIIMYPLPVATTLVILKELQLRAG